MALHAAALIPLSLFGAMAGSLPQQLNLLLSPDETCSQGTFIEARVAQTPAERAVGLSGRSTPLGPNEGMLFIGDSSGDVNSFWMKDTLIPLSVLFFDNASRLLSADDMPVETDPAHPTQIYTESRAPWVAIEIAGGNAARYTAGTTVLCVDPG